MLLVNFAHKKASTNIYCWHQLVILKCIQQNIAIQWNPFYLFPLFVSLFLSLRLGRKKKTDLFETAMVIKHTNNNNNWQIESSSNEIKRMQQQQWQKNRTNWRKRKLSAEKHSHCTITKNSMGDRKIGLVLPIQQETTRSLAIIQLGKIMSAQNRY